MTPSWRTDKRSAAARGYGHAWRKRRLAHLTAHPLCVMCEREGKVTAANVADHITPHNGDPELFKGPLQSLCMSHHSRDKQIVERTGRVIGGSADGTPLDPNHHWNKS